MWFESMRNRRLQAKLDQALPDYLMEVSQRANDGVLKLLHLTRSDYDGSYIIGFEVAGDLVAIQVGVGNVKEIEQGMTDAVLLDVPVDKEETLPSIVRCFNELETIDNDDHRAWNAVALNASLYLHVQDILQHLWPEDERIAALAEQYFE